MFLAAVLIIINTVDTKILIPAAELHTHHPRHVTLFYKFICIDLIGSVQIIPAVLCAHLDAINVSEPASILYIFQINLDIIVEFLVGSSAVIKKDSNFWKRHTKSFLFGVCNTTLKHCF